MVFAQRQTIDRERKQPEVIMMRPMAAWRARTAVAEPLEVVDCLLETLPLGVLSGTRFDHRMSGRDVVGRPMMPRARGRIGIIEEDDKTSSFRRCAAPI